MQSGTAATDFYNVKRKLKRGGGGGGKFNKKKIR